MPSGYESTDFLACIDAPLSPSSRESILSQIRASRAPTPSSSTLHPKVKQSYMPTFTPAMLAEHDRIARGVEATPAGSGIDMSRYNDVSAPDTPTTSTSDEEKPEILNPWRDALRRAYANNTYITSRLSQLSLLETYGRNTWLVGNESGEQILRGLEREYMEAKAEIERIEVERRTRQLGVSSEMQLLEDDWRKAVRGLVEVQIATEELQTEILRRRTEATEGGV